MREPWYVLSPCGTSLWNNGATTKEEGHLVRKYANASRREDVPEQDCAVLDALLAKVQTELLSGGEEAAAKLSAELNGLLKLYGGKIASGQDYHLLLCTDTWLGEASGQLVAEWLKQRGIRPEVKRQKDLRTNDLPAFQYALSELVAWFQQTLPGYRQRHYRIIFNLTGGFKGVLNFLQVLAMFYADETVYLFETGDLMRIPRLPIRLTAEETVRDNLRILRRLAVGLEVPDVSKLPETFLLQLDGQAMLSAWGELIWNQYRDAIYGERLWEAPSLRLVYGAKFGDSVRNLAPDRLIEVNSQINSLVKHLETGGTVPDSLSFKPLQGKGYLPSTHEFYAWSDGNASRVLCHYQGEPKVLVLDILRKHL